MNKESYSEQLSHTDFKRVMDVCEKLHRAEPGDSFIHHSYATLNQAFDNMCFSAAIYGLEPFRLREQKIHTPDYDYWIFLFKEHICDRPDRQYFITVMDSDRGMIPLGFTVKEFHYSTLYTELYDQIQLPCQLWIGIRDGNELLNCIYSLERECTEEQLAMVFLIQSDLESAWKNSNQVRTLRQELNILNSSTFQSEEEKAVAAQNRKALDSLTDRQRDVVKQVALGKDNQQIAEELKICVMTVKTHLKTIFLSLHVQHRTELAAKWRTAYFVHLPT
jgi:DNA-binding CsgD family transcriptional regulator